MRIALAAALLAPLLAFSACKTAMIPGTNVEDTPENRRVIEFLAKYRQAIMEKSPDAVVGLCAKDYFEDNGTVDQADDYGIDKLRAKLTADFARTKQIELSLVVQQIVRPDKDDGTVKVAYRYNERALVDLPAGERWISLTDVNRLVLRKTDDSFLIASGL